MCAVGWVSRIFSVVLGITSTRVEVIIFVCLSDNCV